MRNSLNKYVHYCLELARQNGDSLWQITEQEYEQITRVWEVLISGSEDPDPKHERLILSFIWALNKYHNIRGLWRDEITWCKRGLLSARFLNDPEEEMKLLNNIGYCHEVMGNPLSALEIYNQALNLCEKITIHPAQKGVILNNIASVHYELGSLEKALTTFLQSLEIHQEFGPRSAIARALNNVGQIYSIQGSWKRRLSIFNKGFFFEKNFKIYAARQLL